MQSTSGLPYLVSVDPSRSAISYAVYRYGEERYATGFWRGVAYTSMAAIFLYSFKKLIASAYSA